MKNAQEILAALASGEMDAEEFRHAARKHSAPWVVIHLVEGSPYATLREQGNPAGRQIRVKDIPKMKRKHNVVAVVEFSAAAGMDQPEDLASAFSYEHWSDEQIEAELKRLRAVEALENKP